MKGLEGLKIVKTLEREFQYQQFKIINVLANEYEFFQCDRERVVGVDESSAEKQAIEEISDFISSENMPREYL